MDKFTVLAKHLNLNMDEYESMKETEENIFTIGREEYTVLTDQEAQELAANNILETVWAFKPYFLVTYMTDVDVDTIITMQKSYEDSNKVILRLIDDKAHFIKDAILSDGRGHFISNYDGNEHEVGEFYIYRLN